MNLYQVFTQYKHKVLKDYKYWIEIIKEKAFQMNVPLRGRAYELSLQRS